jgi:UDP:flavonoid glycosyltransferase YjiC (YdhE family)
VRALVCTGFDEGHALPGLALTRAMRERGHDVAVELSARWQETVEGLGAEFVPGVEYAPFAIPGVPGTNVVDRTRSLAAHLEADRPDVVIADLVNPAAGLAAELTGIPWVTLVPTVYPVQASGQPPFLSGLSAARGPVGRLAWRGLVPVLGSVRSSDRWVRSTPALVGRARTELGLPPLGPDPGPLTTYGPLGAELVIVAVLPQLEYPRRWPDRVKVVGPAQFEVPHPPVDLPEGDDPLVVIASSTVPDPKRSLIRVALEALASEPVRVIAALNRRGERWPGEVPANAKVVDWLAYSQVMGEASLVVATGGMGTVARALSAGTPLLVCPHGAETAENGARVAWAGAGAMLPARLLGPTPLRLAVRRLLAEHHFAERAGELASWAASNDGATRAAELVESHAAAA